MELSSVLSSVYSDVTNGGMGCNDVGLPNGYAHVDVIENSEKGIHVSIYDAYDNVKLEAEVDSEISALMVLDKYNAQTIGKATINISGEWVEIEIRVSELGNLVLDGIGSVTYEMTNEVIEFSRWEDEKNDN